MADVKISALPAVVTAATTDIFAIVQGGVTYKATLTQVVAAIPDATGSVRGLLSAADWTTFNSKQSALTFSTGLTNAAGTVTGNLSTGVAGGQSVIGGTAASNSLTLSSTSNATKGKILFGTSAYDEVNNRLGIGTQSPTDPLHVTGSVTATGALARGVLFANTLVAAANNDVLVGVDINPAFTIGAFTGLKTIGLRIQNGVSTFNTSEYTYRDVNTDPENYGISTISIRSSASIGNKYQMVDGGTGSQSWNFINDNSANNRIRIANINAQMTLNTAGSETGILRFGTKPSSGGLVTNFQIWSNGNVTIQNGGSFTDAGYRLDVNGTARFQGNVTISTKDIVTDTTTGSKIATGNTQKLGFWNATPIAQPTTAVAAATLVGGGGTTLTDTDTFDGYTLQQVVKALRNAGLLA